MGIRGEKMDRLFQKLGFFKEELGDEGYELFIDNNQVVLAANTPQGLFYGKQSLIQLIRGAQNNTLQGPVSYTHLTINGSHNVTFHN